jgi:hypothetical protein
VASKSAENAVRMAALFHLFEGGSPNDQIDLCHMKMGTECAAWYIAESRRILSGYAVPEPIRCARLLLDWLVTADEHQTPHNGMVAVNQRLISRYGPNRLRMKDARDQAVRLLVDHGYARMETIGRQTHVVLNPAAIEGDL